MSVKTAVATIEGKLARGLNVRAEALRSEHYGALERSQEGSGVHYPGNPRRSSAPGEPPARQSGRLQEATAVLSRATPDRLEATVGPRPQPFRRTAPYPEFLEFGTIRMAPRPSWAVAIREFRAKTRGINAAWPGGEP